jgi:RNA polymerase sigma-70 factor (sigma-E family)
MRIGGVVSGMSERGGDFDEFVVASANRLLRSAFALTGDRTAAEDLVQDVLERLYVAWPRVDDPYAYTRRSLVNHSSNRWRHRARRPETHLSEAHTPAVTDLTGRSDDHDAIIRALATLPARQRAVIVLRFLDDLSEADTAVTLSCSVGTVKSQTARALARLREVLHSDDDHPLANTRSTT